MDLLLENWKFLLRGLFFLRLKKGEDLLWWGESFEEFFCSGFRRRSMAYHFRESWGEIRLRAEPSAPALAVRPMRWT